MGNAQMGQCNGFTTSDVEIYIAPSDPGFAPIQAPSPINPPFTGCVGRVGYGDQPNA